jgi:hypothetical protein
MMTQAITLTRPDRAKTATDSAWKVAPKKEPAKQPFLRRILGPKEPTTYQRCLAVHLHFAAPRSVLS